MLLKNKGENKKQNEQINPKMLIKNIIVIDKQDHRNDE